MARTYKRDKNGRFAGGGGGGGGGKKGGSSKQGASRSAKALANAANKAGDTARKFREAESALSAAKGRGDYGEAAKLQRKVGQLRRRLDRQDADVSTRYRKESAKREANPAVSQRVATRYENKSRANELKAKGTTAIGGRVKAAGFSGQKAAQQRAGGLRSQSTVRLKPGASTVGAGTRSGLNANAAQVAKSRSKAASKGTQKMSKAPASAAKERYKQLSGEARKSSPNRSAAENRKAAGAKRSLGNMIKKRGR